MNDFEGRRPTFALPLRSYRQSLSLAIDRCGAGRLYDCLPVLRRVSPLFDPCDLARSRSAIGDRRSASWQAPRLPKTIAGSIAPAIYSRLSLIARWCALPLLSFDQPSQRKWDHGFCPRLLINLELYLREGSHQARIARHFLNKRPDRMNPRD